MTVTGDRNVFSPGSTKVSVFGASPTPVVLAPQKPFFFCFSPVPSLLVLLQLLVLSGLIPSYSRAATFTVTNLNNSGTGSLRQAIVSANAAADSDTIDATQVNGVINLTSALPDLK